MYSNTVKVPTGSRDRRWGVTACRSALLEMAEERGHPLPPGRSWSRSRRANERGKQASRAVVPSPLEALG